MTLCPACSEPLDDFSPCACAFGVERRPSVRVPEAPISASARPIIGAMRGMVERRLRHRALAAGAATITVTDPKGPSR
jgi:hypothetical protein